MILDPKLQEIWIEDRIHEDESGRFLHPTWFAIDPITHEELGGPFSSLESIEDFLWDIIRIE